MIYATVSRNADGKIVSAEVIDGETFSGSLIESRWNWATFDAAKEVAAALGSDYIATDAGPNVSPRYDIIKLPKVGDKVSYAFNGDSYPCGVITAISASLKVISVSEPGVRFYRVKETGSWRFNRTWFLTSGHCYKQNPEF